MHDPAQAGDRLLFYTDGITEARNRQGSFYPLERSGALLGLPDLGSALDQLIEDVLGHVGHALQDDAAILLIGLGQPLPVPATLQWADARRRSVRPSPRAPVAAGDRSGLHPSRGSGRSAPAPRPHAVAPGATLPAQADAYAYTGMSIAPGLCPRRGIARMIFLMAEPARAPAGRVPWGTISREDIVAAAVRMVTAGGEEEISIRRLAASLGVAPMALYRHISDKDDLLDEVVDRLLAGVWRPAAAEDDWQAWTVEAASRLRDFLVSQPAALHVYLGRPVVSPAAVDRMDAMMRVLRQAGIGEAAARSAYGAVHTYTLGFAALEASRARQAPGSEDASDLARQLAAYITTGHFTAGLRYLLEGISSHAGTRQGTGWPASRAPRRHSAPGGRA